MQISTRVYSVRLIDIVTDTPFPPHPNPIQPLVLAAIALHQRPHIGSHIKVVIVHIMIDDDGHDGLSSRSSF